MELQRGVCSLCSENNKVLTSSDAEEFSKFLPQIFNGNFITDTEFQKIKNQLKICSICCYKIQLANETKNLLYLHRADENEKTKSSICHFCKTEKCLMKVENNWKYFNERTEGYLDSADFPICVCPRCLFYFDIIFNIKTKLSHKFPYLSLRKKKSGHGSHKQNDTPKRKSFSKSPPGSKKRKIFDNCFTYLQPLCNNNYHIDEELKQDKRLYKKIAYVNLKNEKDFDIKETPKVRPIIKIKLKTKHKKNEKERAARQCKSEEVAKKSVEKSKARRHSFEQKEKSPEVQEAQLEETPKAASISDLVPKRRVSVYIPENEDSKLESSQVDIKQIDEIVEKYATKPSLEENEKTSEEKEILSQENEVIEENGIEKPIVPDDTEIITEQAENITSEKNFTVDNEPEENNQENLKIDNESEKDNQEIIITDDPIQTPAADESPMKTHIVIESNNEDSDSNSSDRNKSKSNLDDSLNGSERKKKRVTFSDDIN
jgi:hypothetical protein